MRRMTEQERARFATRPDQIPADAQCDRCEQQAVARGTDGDRAFALCADDYLAEQEERRAERRAGPRGNVRFRHAQTGEVRAGYWTREWPEYNAIGVYVPGHGEVVVHRENVVQ